MSRRKGNYKREVIPDPVHNDLLVAKFVNQIMKDGKKSIAQKIFYDALSELKKSFDDPMVAFKKAVENIKPALEVRSRRIGGSTYQVPMDIRPKRQLALAMRWLVEFARKRNEKTMSQRLAGELSEAYHNRGNAFKKRDDVHKMADANKVFAHYKW